MPSLYLFAVCLTQDPASHDHWIEFYWAEDSDHAEEQAKDANPDDAIVCVACFPEMYAPQEVN